MGRFKDMDISNTEVRKAKVRKLSNVRSEPNPSSEAIANLGPNEEVWILESDDEKYFKIRFNRGRIGFILKDLIKE